MRRSEADAQEALVFEGVDFFEQFDEGLALLNLEQKAICVVKFVAPFSSYSLIRLRRSRLLALHLIFLLQTPSKMALTLVVVAEAVRVDGLADEGDFFAAVLDEGLAFLKDFLEAAAFFAAAAVGNDAVGAEFVAAVADGDEGLGFGVVAVVGGGDFEVVFEGFFGDWFEFGLGVDFAHEVGEAGKFFDA